MKLFLITQCENSDYDSYDSAVVAAPDEAAAKRNHPAGLSPKWTAYSSWCSSPKYVTARYLGEAADDVRPGVICASFNAG
jgi:hypothetical protein